MATIPQPYYRTDIFARESQRLLPTSGSMQPTDAFARCESQAVGVTLPEHRRLTIALSIEGASEPVEFAYTASDRGLPQWVGSVLRSLALRWGARRGWDGYCAEPTNPQLVVKLLNILSDLMQQDFGPPQITPLADGGVQAEWHSGAQDLEIVVPADQEPSYYYFDAATGHEEEAPAELHYPHVQNLIEILSSSE